MTCIDITDIVERLAGYYTVEEIDVWLSAPHPQLDGQTPEGLIASGGRDQVTAIIDRLDADAYF